jgi:hypothetical protein
MPFLGCGFASQTQGSVDTGIHAFEITAKAVSLFSPWDFVRFRVTVGNPMLHPYP